MSAVSKAHFWADLLNSRTEFISYTQNNWKLVEYLSSEYEICALDFFFSYANSMLSASFQTTLWLTSTWRTRLKQPTPHHQKLWFRKSRIGPRHLCFFKCKTGCLRCRSPTHIPPFGNSALVKLELLLLEPTSALLAYLRTKTHLTGHGLFQF